MNRPKTFNPKRIQNEGFPEEAKEDIIRLFKKAVALTEFKVAIDYWKTKYLLEQGASHTTSFPKGALKPVRYNTTELESVGSIDGMSEEIKYFEELKKGFQDEGAFVAVSTNFEVDVDFSFSSMEQHDDPYDDPCSVNSTTSIFTGDIYCTHPNLYFSLFKENSKNFLEFLLGRYNPFNTAGIYRYRRMLTSLTQDELEKVASGEFEIFQEKYFDAVQKNTSYLKDEVTVGDGPREVSHNKKEFDEVISTFMNAVHKYKLEYQRHTLAIGDSPQRIECYEERITTDLHDSDPLTIIEEMQYHQKKIEEFKDNHNVISVKSNFNNLETMSFTSTIRYIPEQEEYLERMVFLEIIKIIMKVTDNCADLSNLPDSFKELDVKDYKGYRKRVLEYLGEQTEHFLKT